MKVSKVVIFSLVAILVFLTIFAWVKRDGYNFNNTKRGVYELDLQTYKRVASEVDGEPSSHQLFTWRLDVPRAYIRSHFGRNGSPRYDPNRSGKNDYSIKLFTVIDTEAMKVLPDPNVLNGYPSENSMDISITNSFSKSRKVADKNPELICWTYRQLAEASNLRGRDCTQKKCTLLLPIDGWSTRISIPRDMYLNDPQKYCRLAKEFLDGLTLHRDGLSRVIALKGEN